MALGTDKQIELTRHKRNILLRKKNREIYKENNEKRRERKKKLIKLGTLFFILDLLDEPQEIMLGFLKNYKDLSENEKEKYCEIGTEILATREQKKYPEAISEYKRMLHKMITKSSLLEKEKIHLENPNTILGFLNSYK